MATIRQEKISRLVQKELSTIFQQESRTLFGGNMISVTIVRMSPDLSFAKCYISIFAPGKEQEVLKLVQQNTKQIRKRIGNKVRHQLRIVPEFAFFIDDSLEYSQNIDQLLKS